MERQASLAEERGAPSNSSLTNSLAPAVDRKEAKEVSALP